MKKILTAIVVCMLLCSNAFALTLSNARPVSNTNTGITTQTISATVANNTNGNQPNIWANMNANISIAEFQELKKQVKELTKSNEDMKKQIESLKIVSDLEKKVNKISLELNLLKGLLSSLDQVVTKFKKAFEKHTHDLHGYTSEWAWAVDGWAKNTIYLLRSSKISKEKRDKLKTTSTPTAASLQY